MKRLQLIAGGLALALLLCGATTANAVAAPATAGPAPFAVIAAATGNCPSNAFCIYRFADHKDSEGFYFPAPGTAGFPAHRYTVCSFSGKKYNSGTPIDNTATSMVNNTRFYVVLWQLKGCTGTKYVARPHSEDKTFVNNDFDNRASALEFVDDRT